MGTLYSHQILDGACAQCRSTLPGQSASCEEPLSTLKHWRRCWSFMKCACSVHVVVKRKGSGYTGTRRKL